MKIRRLQGIEQREIAALAFIEAVHFVLGCATLGGNKFQPPVARTVEDLQGLKGKTLAARIYPGQEGLKVDIYCKGSRFIHQAKARTKRRNEDRTPLPMSISSPALQCSQEAGMFIRTERCFDSLPISTEVL